MPASRAGRHGAPLRLVPWLELPMQLPSLSRPLARRSSMPMDEWPRCAAEAASATDGARATALLGRRLISVAAARMTSQWHCSATRQARRKSTMVRSITLLATASFALTAAFALPALAQDVLPRPEQPFKGHIGRTVGDSTKDFPQEVEAPKGAPNILLILTDDVGFGASSTFGGPIPTPTFDRLAKNGLRYNQFHTTALCSPTRAALLTGRNHHSCATGVIMELGTGFPGYNTLMPKSCGTFAEVLRQNGWNTSWYGKNHNVPDWQSSQEGPFDLWPTGLGFERFYGFIGGDTDQWHPALFDGTNPIETPAHDPKYHLDADLANHAIAWIQQQHSLAPDKPFFAYYTPGLC